MLASFLLAFPALFSIVNPVSGAFIFREATAERSHGERVALAGRVALYSLLVMAVALSVGSYVLAFFGVSIAALRIAGGLVLALFAWGLLDAPERREGRKQGEAAGASDAGDVAFFPLTLPFTTGPGTIAVCVALGAGHPPGGLALLAFLGGTGCAALLTAAIVWAFYSQSDRLGLLLGSNGSRTVTRLSAFLLLCIGVQILITGVSAVLEPMLARP